MDNSRPDVSPESTESNDDRPPVHKESEYATLGGVLRKIALPLRPRVLAYLCGLLFVVLLASYEVRRVEAIEATIPPLAPDSRIAPERAQTETDPDGIKWVIYAQRAYDEGSIRINRWTDTDNYPSGRFVAWSSPPMWWLEGLAYVRHVWSGQDMKTAIAEVSPHYNTFLWIFAAMTMGLMCVFAYGWRGAAVVPAIYATLFLSKYGSYSPDHHLWILLDGLGLMICLGAPFYKERPKTERLWFIGAAFFCAMGFWASAATQTIALIGVFLGFLFVPTEAAKRVNSANWRLFGELAAVLTLAAYFFEFYPAMPIRVELNGPVYAAGILVSGIWFWQIHEFSASGHRWDALEPRPLVYSALFMLLAAIPIIVYLPYCFSLSDPFFARWEAQISEEQPIDISSFMTIQHGFLFAAGTAALAGIIARWRERGIGVIAALALLTGLAVTYSYFGVTHNRFSETVLGCVAVIICWGLPACRKDVAGWFAAAFLALLGIASVHRSGAMTYSTITGGTPDYFRYTLNVRVAGDSLMRVSKGHVGAVLAPSNEATLINYYTKYPVFGTAYWENKDGLYYTNAILFYEMPTGTEGWTAIRARLALGGVSYILIPKEYGYDSSYMIYDQARLVDPSHCFAYYLIHTDADKFVPWLKLEKDDEKFRIFSFHTENTTLSHEEKATH